MKSDFEIQQDVMEELRWQPLLTPANIGVAVKNGIVTLSGTVSNYAQKLAAENATKKVTGVLAVAEDIQIGVSTYGEKTDADIADAAVKALRWHSIVPPNQVKVKVDEGFVTLDGELEWEYQRMAARNAVANLLGVRGVLNRITLKPRVTPGDVKNKINAALHRAATVDAQRVQVETEGNKVILRGTVRSFAEKEDAEDAAWCAPGVNKVESHLVVEPQMELSF